MPVGRRNIQQLFDEPQPEVAERSSRAEILEQRNKAICARVYYYRHLHSVSYDVVLQIISGEFWLSKLQIGRILNDNMVELRRLKDAETTIKDLREEWTHLSW